MQNEIPPIPQVNTEFKDNVFFVFNDGTRRNSGSDSKLIRGTEGIIETFYRLILAFDFLTFLTYFVAVTLLLEERDFIGFILVFIYVVSPRIIFLTLLWLIKPNFDINGPIYNYKTIGFRFMNYISDK